MKLLAEPGHEAAARRVGEHRVRVAAALLAAAEADGATSQENKNERDEGHPEGCGQLRTPDRSTNTDDVPEPAFTLPSKPFTLPIS